MPDYGGTCIGLHYFDWSFWDHTNDPSNNGSDVFTVNNEIELCIDGNCDDGGGGGDENTFPLSGFAVYSSEASVVKDRAQFIGGGAVGSNGIVDVGADARIYGNCISGGNAILRFGAVVNGDMYVNGTYVLQDSATVTGEIYENAQVAVVEIPQKPAITTGHENINVAQETQLELAPGLYNNVVVNWRGSLKLQPGIYQFNSLQVGTEAKIDLTSLGSRDNVEINVEQQLTLEYNSRIHVAETHKNPSGVRLYSNYADALTISTNAQIYGILTAPHAEVTMQSGSSCNGALYAKRVNVDPDAVINSELTDPVADMDEDGVPNITEIFMNTDPASDTSYIPVAIPSPPIIEDNSVENVIYYDYSEFYNEQFEGLKEFKVTIPAGALSTNVPPFVYVMNKLPDSYTTPDSTGFKQNGRVFAIDGDFTGNEEVVFELPVAKGHPGDKSLMRTAFLPVNESLSKTEGSVKTAVEQTRWSTTNKNLIAVTAQDGYALAYAPVASIVAYADGSATYSSKEDVGIDISIYLNTSDWQGYTGTFLLYYTDKDGTDQILPVSLEYGYPSVAGYIYISSVHGSESFTCEGPITINRMSIEVPEADFYWEDTDIGYAVDNGTLLNIRTIKKPERMMPDDPFYDAVAVWKSPAPLKMESFNMAGNVKMRSEIVGEADSDYSYYCAITDHLGSTRMVVNQNGEAQEAVGYTPFGIMKQVGGLSAEDPVREKFTGKEFDQEGEDAENGVSGIQCYYFGARYLDPEIGYWFSPDKAAQFSNLYAYAGNGANPVVMIDKDGNFIFTGVTLAIIGASAVFSGTMTAVKVSQAGGSVGQVFAGFGIGLVAGAAGGVAGVVTGGAATPGINAALGTFASTAMGGLISATASGAISGTVGGATSGLIGGTLTTGMMTGDLSSAARAGLLGMVNGMATGAITGAVGGAAGYGVSKGVGALRNAHNAGKPTPLAKSAQKTDLKFVKDVTKKGIKTALGTEMKSLIPSETNAPPLDLTKYFTVKNPTLDVQPPIFDLPITPTQIPTTPVQMSPTIINPLPPGVTPAGGGNYYMITPNADFYFGF